MTPKGAARACFSTAGQLCLSIERLYIANTIYDEFVRKLVHETQALKLGKGAGFDYDIGTLTSQRQFDSVERHVADARSHGATVLVGGRPRPDLGPYFYGPTILESVTLEMEVHANETFGPVVSLYRVTATTKQSDSQTTPNSGSTPASGPQVRPGVAVSPNKSVVEPSISMKATALLTPPTMPLWAE